MLKNTAATVFIYIHICNNIKHVIIIKFKVTVLQQETKEVNLEARDRVIK